MEEAHVYQIEDLIVKHLRNELSAAEAQFLDDWKKRSENNRQLFEELTNDGLLTAHLNLYNSIDVSAGLSKLHTHVGARGKVTPMRRWQQYVAVAAVLLFVVAGLWLIVGRRDKTSDHVQQAQTGHPVRDVEAPKVTKAMITLADGRTVALDSVTSGMLATQGNVSVVRNAAGDISYTGSLSQTEGNILYNTLYNPRGSKVIHITLGDGSRVWLNAESSLRYPVAFAGNERRVAVTGEAYFEVARHTGKKFYVDASGVTTEVLGTHFNVHAYADEKDISVTLLEGKIKTAGHGQSAILKPGQQVVATGNGQLAIRNEVDVDAVMAWKNGMFSFKSTDIKTIMLQIERWYDVEVSYEGEVPHETITGDVPRNVNVSEVMKMLEYAGLHFQIEGKKVVVKQ
jgi:transmembrane sensor